MKIYEVLNKVYQLKDDEMSIDDRSISIVNTLFNLLKENIKPEIKHDNSYWKFYITEEKGSLEEYKKYIEKDCYDDEDIDYLLEEYKYYEEKEWINIQVVETDNKYRLIKFNNMKYILISPENNKNFYKYDISELLEWLLAKTKTVIEELKNKTYNEKIIRELPDKFKTGIIKRSDLWKLKPEIKKNYLELIDQQRIKEFVEYINTSEESSKERLETMTVNQYLKYCSYCYCSNKMEGYDCMNDYELFCRHSCSRGNGDGFDKVDRDSVADFDKVRSLIDNRFSLDYDFGGHTWAIVDGSSRSRIYLRPKRDDKGYYVSLYGGDKYSTVEVANTYIELRKNNIPVKLWDSEIMVKKLKGDDFIGIVPYGVFPVYCDSYFTEDDVVSFCNYEDIKDIDNVNNYISWHELPMMELIKN